MMDGFFQVLSALAAVVIAIEILAVLIGLRALAKRQDRLYQEKYQEHLRLKNKVLGRLKETSESLKLD